MRTDSIKNQPLSPDDQYAALSKKQDKYRDISDLSNLLVATGVYLLICIPIFGWKSPSGNAHVFVWYEVAVAVVVAASIVTGVRCRRRHRSIAQQIEDLRRSSK